MFRRRVSGSWAVVALMLAGCWLGAAAAWASGPTEKWSAQFPGSGLGTVYDSGQPVDLKADLNRVYVAGLATKFGNPDKFFVLTAYNVNTGNVVWQKEFSPGDETSLEYYVTLGLTGHVIYTGARYQQGGNGHFGVRAYRISDGYQFWVKEVQNNLNLAATATAATANGFYLIDMQAGNFVIRALKGT